MFWGTRVKKTPHDLCLCSILLLSKVPLVHFYLGARAAGYLLLEERIWCLIQPVGADEGGERITDNRDIIMMLFLLQSQSL